MSSYQWKILTRPNACDKTGRIKDQETDLLKEKDTDNWKDPTDKEIVGQSPYTVFLLVPFSSDTVRRPWFQMIPFTHHPRHHPIR